MRTAPADGVLSGSGRGPVGVPEPYREAMRAWIDGRLLDAPTGPAVALTDHGYTVGDGVFEALKVVGGRVRALEMHLDRLAAGAQTLGLPEPDRDAVRDGIAAVLADQDAPMMRLRVTLTGGPSPLGYTRGEGAGTLSVIATPLAPPAPSAVVATVPWPRNERSAVAGVKTTSYAEQVVAMAEARQRGADEAVFANLAGHLCEGASSNVFYVVDGELRTPSLASGCLPGVTRALVIAWTGAREVDEPIATVLREASEAFLTSTTRDVQHIRRWDGVDLPPGQVTAATAQMWRERENELLDVAR
ncbi:aminodeoxychorismate lyase [Nocardioides fonticola]|uniref:Aminodeoxychorismate lyase n=2 Tax=Nocardioides fonticola TaxID=450363 RepID=A0ABP7XK33_9ACTN